MRTHCITIDLANQGCRQVRARFDGGRMSSDGGALLLQAVDQRIGLTRRLAACFVDHRNPRRCEHFLQRLFGLALGYEDLCDHDWLRERDRGHPLAGSSTLNRLELGTPEQAPQDRYKRIVADPQRLDALLVELFLDSHAAAPEEIVLDVDATDDPLHEQLYCARGDMENRIKEQQLDLFADRTSAATRRANQLRLYWALFAAALLEVLRQRGRAGTGAGAGAVRDDPGAAAEGGRGGAGERAEGLGVVVLGVSTPGAVRAQPGAVAGGDAGIACGPAGETAGAPRAAARGRCVHPAPIR